MAKITLTKEAAERIVSAGGRRLYSNVQKVAPPVRTWRQTEPRKVLVRNQTYGDIGIGEPLCLVGLANELSFDEQAEEYQKKGICLRGDSYDGNYPDRPIAYAIEPIEQDATGECWVDGVRPAILTEYEQADHYANVDNHGVYTCGTEGRFYIIGKSEGKEIPSETTGESETEEEEGETTPALKYFGYVAPLPYEEGHYVGTTVDPISGPNATTNVEVNATLTLENVKCPLLRAATTNPQRAAESIEEGTKVIVSKNRLTGAWEIIEAQCPIETDSNSGSES